MKLRNKIICGALALATYTGTFRNNSGIPLIYNHITRDSYGICLGIKNEVDENVNYTGLLIGVKCENRGNIYGGQLSALINYNVGKINGVNVALLGNATEGNLAEVNGLEASILANVGTNEDISKTQGIQFGIFNSTKTPEDCLQIGFKVNPEKQEVKK